MKERLKEVIQVARLIILLWLFMIFSLPVKQVRFDTYYFSLTLVLVIPQIEIWDFKLFLMLLGLLANKLCFLRSQAGGAQETGSCIPRTLKIPYHKWEGLLFTSVLLHNFTLVKVKEVCLTGWFKSCKILFFSCKNVIWR